MINVLYLAIYLNMTHAAASNIGYFFIIIYYNGDLNV